MSSDPRPSPAPGRDPLEEGLREIGHPDKIIEDLRAEVARLEALLASRPLPAAGLSELENVVREMQNLRGPAREGTVHEWAARLVR